MAASQPDRFQRRRARNRAALLEAAIALFQRQGTRATKIEDICERADVARRTFFNHFETREQLVQEIALQRSEQLATLLDARAGEPGPAGERFARLLAEMGTYLAARPAYRELVAEMLSLRFAHGSEAARSGVIGAAVHRFVVSAAERGELRAASSPTALADLCVGALMTALANWCADDAFDLEAALAESAALLSDLLDPPHERSAR